MEDQSKAVAIFQFNRKIPLRVQMIDGNPWFVVADACKILELGNVSRVIDRLDPDGVTQSKVIDSLGREQEQYLANEPNLYRLIFRSDKPEAKRFQDWVYNEVLPSIRKTGRYSISKASRQIRSDSSAERRLLPPAEKDQFILRVVDMLGIANGRDVQRYTRWYSGSEARYRMAQLAEQGELVIVYKSRKTVRYALSRKQIAS